MWWEPKQAHPATSRQTSETADYNPVAPSTGVPTAGRKTPGAVRRSAAVLVESKGGPHPNTAPRSPWSYQQGQRAPVPGCCAEDAFPAPAPQARGRKTIQPDSEKSRASPNCPRCLTAKRIIQNDSRRPVFQQTARDRFDRTARDAIAGLCVAKGGWGVWFPALKGGEPGHLNMVEVVLPENLFVA